MIHPIKLKKNGIVIDNNEARSDKQNGPVKVVNSNSSLDEIMYNYLDASKQEKGDFANKAKASKFDLEENGDYKDRSDKDYCHGTATMNTLEKSDNLDNYSENVEDKENAIPTKRPPLSQNHGKNRPKLDADIESDMRSLLSLDTKRGRTISKRSKSKRRSSSLKKCVSRIFHKKDKLPSEV